MGTQNFINKGKGASASKVYAQLRESAQGEYGHQEGYSGQINSTYGFTDLTSQFKASGKSLEKFIDISLQMCNKGECLCVCVKPPVENVAKIKSTVEHVVEKGTRKWVLKYVVEDMHDDFRKAFNTKGDAVKAARAYTEKTGNHTVVFMEKVLEKGNALVARIKYKSSSKESPGEWIFFGAAPC